MLLRVYHQLRQQLPLLHQRLIALCLLVLLLLLIWPQPRQPATALSARLLAETVRLAQQQQYGVLLAEPILTSWQRWLEPPLVEDPYVKHYDIVTGDSLSRIFQRFGFGYSLVQRIMAADESLLALDVLRPGNRRCRTNRDPATRGVR